MSSQPIHTARITLIGNLSIFMIGLGFAVRTKIAGDLERDIYSLIDAANSATLVSEALTMTFIGFALTLLFGSAIVDWIGAKMMLLLSALGYIAGSVLILVAAMTEVGDITQMLVNSGLLLTGLGWGAVEAASNPIVAAVDPENKTHRLNVLHAWWPAGIVAGGLCGLLIGQVGLAWESNLIILIIPAAVMAILVLTTRFPVTERVASGVSYSEMLAEVYRRPLFLFFWICMFATAATELAPGQWVDLSLSRVVGMPGIVILIYVSTLMFVMRHFAGALARRISPIGILWGGSLFAAVGLYGLSLSSSPVTALGAATLWGIGVCYMWPTMLAQVNDRFPKGGALMMGLMGFAGGLSIYFVLPRMGAIFDAAKIEYAGGEDKLAAMVEGSPELNEVLRHASIESFQSVAIVPVALLIAFALIALIDRVSSQK